MGSSQVLVLVNVGVGEFLQKIILSFVHHTDCEYFKEHGCVQFILLATLPMRFFFCSVTG